MATIFDIICANIKMTVLSSIKFLAIVSMAFTASTILPLQYYGQEENLLSFVSATTTINGPFITKFANDVSGNGVFKVNLGLTDINKTTGLIEVCVNAEVSAAQPQPQKICNISNSTGEYLHYYPADNCSSCVTPIGTVVFPNNLVTEGNKITACVTSLNITILKCGDTINHKGPSNENIVISLK